MFLKDPTRTHKLSIAFHFKRSQAAYISIHLVLQKYTVLPMRIFSLSLQRQAFFTLIGK